MALIFKWGGGNDVNFERDPRAVPFAALSSVSRRACREQLRRYFLYAVCAVYFLAVFVFQKTFGHHALELLKEGIKIAIEVQQGNRLLMKFQLIPSNHFKKFVHGAEAARQRYRRIAHFTDGIFALVH